MRQNLDPAGPSYDTLFSKLIWTETAKSWEDFLKWIGELQGLWCFRGQRESAWTLQTSLDRVVRVSFENLRVSTPHGRYFLLSGSNHLDRRNVEGALLFRFKQQAHQFIAHTPPVDDKASWFALMQHYGTPTRLLDWTSSPYVALYFAVEEKPQETNDEKEKDKGERDDGYSAVWAIDLDTHESLDREQRMIAMVNHGIDRYARLGGTCEFQPSERLRDEQKRVVQQVLDSRDFAINLRGAAGTGKTATLQEIDRGLRESGREVTAVVPTRGAVEELQKVGFRDAMTVSRLLGNEPAQSALRGKVLIVDEAGMISGRQMEGVLRLAEQHMARVVFSGDTRQIQSVEASDALRILERESQMKSVPLTGVQPQTHAQYRDAIQTLRQAP